MACFTACSSRSPRILYTILSFTAQWAAPLLARRTLPPPVTRVFAPSWREWKPHRLPYTLRAPLEETPSAPAPHSKTDRNRARPYGPRGTVPRIAPGPPIAHVLFA